MKPLTILLAIFGAGAVAWVIGLKLTSNDKKAALTSSGTPTSVYDSIAKIFAPDQSLNGPANPIVGAQPPSSVTGPTLCTICQPVGLSPGFWAADNVPRTLSSANSL